MTENNDGNGNYLYRYQPFYRIHKKSEMNNEVVKNLEIFSKRELFFVSPLKFNDPFDCKAFLTYKDCSVENLFNYIYWQFKRSPQRQRTTDQETRKAVLDKLCKTLRNEIFDGSSDLSKSMAEHRKNFLEDVKGDAAKSKPGIGVLSLSEKNKDLLMWGHYADGHKGYCLEFNRIKLEEWVKLIRGKLATVIYNDLYPSIKDYMECDLPPVLRTH